jgi:hypothetical protein
LCRDLTICRYTSAVAQRLLEFVIRPGPRSADALDVPGHAVVVPVPHPSAEPAQVSVYTWTRPYVPTGNGGLPIETSYAAWSSSASNQLRTSTDSYHR